jgi:hypothetical protein
MSEPEDLLVRLARIETKLDAALSRADDHEGRIRSLERARWPLPSLAVVVSVASLAVAAAELVH